VSWVIKRSDERVAIDFSRCFFVSCRRESHKAVFLHHGVLDSSIGWAASCYYRHMILFSTDKCPLLTWLCCVLSLFSLRRFSTNDWWEFQVLSSSCSPYPVVTQQVCGTFVGDLSNPNPIYPWNTQLWSGVEYSAQGLGFRVWGTELGIQCLGFGMCLGFKINKSPNANACSSNQYQLGIVRVYTGYFWVSNEYHPQKPCPDYIFL